MLSLRDSFNILNLGSMNTNQNAAQQPFERAIQFTNDVYVDFVAENSFVSQFFVTYLANLPKAFNHHQIFQNGISFNILLYCTSGCGWFSIGDRVHCINPNQYVLIPATGLRVEYGAQDDGFWGVYIAHFDGQNIHSFNDSFGLDPFISPTDVGGNQKGIDLWEEMYHLLNKPRTYSNYLQANFCLYHFLGSFLFPAQEDQKDQSERWISETVNYMKKMIHEKLSVEDLAERHHLSVSYFSSLFRKAMGLAPLEYFIQLKLQSACSLLKERGLKVKEVADAIGYDDPFHFSRLFKKHMRVSPLAYKSLHRSTQSNTGVPTIGLGIKHTLMAV